MPPPPSVPDAAVPPGRRVSARSWRNVGIFLAALAGVHLLMEPVLPLQNLGKINEKLSYFTRHKDQYDAVFVGSSRVYRQIAPQVFDERVTAATGQPMHSFNMGIPSMFLPESLVVIDHIVAQRPARLRWMFIELDDAKPRLEEHAGLVEREVYWHGWRETALTCINILTFRGIHKGDRVRMLGHQASLFGRCWTHIGVAHEWLATWMQPKRSRPAETVTRVSLGPAWDGYDPYHSTLGQGTSETKGGDADVKNYLAATASLQSGVAQAQVPATASFMMRWLLVDKVRALRARGIEPLFVIPPAIEAEGEFLKLSKQGILPTIFVFNDPAAYPDLYAVNMRADTIHLNEPGALLFTRLLAGKFADYRAHDAARVAAGPR